jgi:putative membrane protein
MDATDLIQWKFVVASLLYTGIGLAIFVISFVVLDLVTPKVSVWKEICEKQNMALAIFLGAIAIGIALIISSAIHG